MSDYISKTTLLDNTIIDWHTTIIRTRNWEMGKTIHTFLNSFVVGGLFITGGKKKKKKNSNKM